MKLNCKPGDLAVIVKSSCGNEGVIVTCVEFLGVLQFVDPRGNPTYQAPAWRVDKKIRTIGGATEDRIPDFRLRPLRDNPGQDETLTWLDVPTKETA